MTMPVARLVIACSLLGSGVARAEHDMGHMATDDTVVTASVALLAAQYDNTTYGGAYQGAIPTLGFARGRFMAMVNIAAYRLEENGRTITGIGDVMAGGSAELVSNGRASFGVSAMAMVPTGEHLLGMGHVMAMPAVFARYHTHPLVLTASLGFNRAIGGAEDHAGHDMMLPLVEPMNMSEIGFSGGGDLMVSDSVTIGGRVSGGTPIGEPGWTHIAGGVRAMWSQGRLSTAAELQAGLVGDPYTVRGVLETSVVF